MGTVQDAGEQGQYAAAMLRVILALKRQPESEPNEVIERVIAELELDGRAFRAFLAEHMQVMRRVHLNSKRSR